MKRISIAVVLAILCLVLLVLGATFGLLATQSGSRWLLNQVPGLTVEGFSGAVLTDWQAEQLDWQQDDLSLRISALQMQLRPSCLLRSALCLDTLTAARIELTLPESAESSEPQQNIELPELQLPLSIEIERIYIGELLLNGELLLADSGLRAQWLADGNPLARIDADRSQIRHQDDNQ